MSDGLENVVAADTVMSHVDGAAGRLIYRGHMMEDLAGRESFETVTRLFWRGFAPEVDEPGFVASLGGARQRAAEVMAPLLPLTDGLSPVEALRLLLSGLSDAETTPHHLLVTAAAPVFTAGIARRRAGLAPVAPSAEFGQAADFLRMLRGAPAPGSHVHALETYLVSVMDHGLNASTFTARVVASTRAGVFSSVVAALSALKGPLHGGAPGPVLDMLDAIGGEGSIEAWLTAELDRGERLMGFGHRVYRVRDPRADVLKRVALTLRGEGNRILFAEAVEAKALELLARRKPDRRLDTNVEFYTALVLEALDLPRDFFTAVFAVGRTVGWTAHVLEQLESSRIIRPQSRYVGPPAA